MQLEDYKDGAIRRRPLWFIITVIICVGIMGGFGLVYLLGLLPWRLK
jgi:hypothetical protein